MTFETNECQKIFRDRFTGASGEPFLDFHDGKDIRGMDVDPSDITLYRTAIKSDICTFYYKSLLSYAEGLRSISRNNLTWATIKLYYSLYYGLRCSLLCRNVVIVRAAKHLYYFRVNCGAKYEKPKLMNDHGGTIEIYLNLFGNSDFICRDKIEDIETYIWMQKCREMVNYKDAVFHDPDTTDLWNAIIEETKRTSLTNLLSLYLDKKERYCFLESDAILAIPTVRIHLVATDVKREKLNVLSTEQQNWIRNIVGDLINDNEINELLL